jgi:hypothetical protein
MVFVQADLLSEKGGECLLVEIMEPNNQVRSEQLIRYEDALITHFSLSTKKSFWYFQYLTVRIL